MMGRKHDVCCAFLVISLMLGVPAFAHHGSAGEDTSKVVNVTGTVTDFQYINPHVQIYVDVKDEHGNVTKWNGELSNALVLRRAGWNSKLIKPGDIVTLNGYQDKKKTPFLRLISVVLADGRVMEAFPRLE